MGFLKGPGPGRVMRTGTTLCVSGVVDRVKKTVLQEAFGDFGHIVRIEVPEGRRVAFVEFESRTDATDAQKAVDGTSVGGVRVTVKLADNRVRNVDGPLVWSSQSTYEPPSELPKGWPFSGVSSSESRARSDRGTHSCLRASAGRRNWSIRDQSWAQNPSRSVSPGCSRDRCRSRSLDQFQPSTAYFQRYVKKGRREISRSDRLKR